MLKRRTRNQNEYAANQSGKHSVFIVIGLLSSLITSSKEYVYAESRLVTTEEQATPQHLLFEKQQHDRAGGHLFRVWDDRDVPITGDWDGRNTTTSGNWDGL